jgi:putative flippase GtrA
LRIMSLPNFRYCSTRDWPGMISKFSGYIVTGGIAAVVDLGGFRLLIASGFPLIASAILSWLTAAVVNYNLTSRFVFKHAPNRQRGLVFLLAAAVGLSVNAGMTTLCAQYFGAVPVLAKFIGIGTAFLFNFLLNVLVVFR